MNDNFAEFETVIIPNGVILNKDSLSLLNDYLAKGGKLIFFGNALVESDKFQIDCGVEYLSSPEFDCDYILVKNPEKENLPNSYLLSYHCGHTVKNLDGEVISQRLTPYFSRFDDVCSPERQIAYNDEISPLPDAVKKENVIYCSHPLPTTFNIFGSVYHKNYFLMLLNRLGFPRAFKIEGLGAEGRATMIKQEDKNRYCLNMTYASPVKRGKAEVIEDIPDIFGIKISLDVPEKIKRAYLGVTGEELNITEENGKQTVTVPKLNCHASVVFEY